MPVSSTRSQTSVRSQPRSPSAGSRTLANSRTAVGHSSRSTFANGRTATADRTADVASFRARGRTTASTQALERRSLGSSTGTLRRGQNNETVRRLQERLSASGFDVGAADGKFGPRTERAVRDFQRSQGLRADGVVGRRTFGALNSSGVGSRNGDGFDAGRTNADGPTRSGNGTNGVAQMNRVNRGPGMSTGTITVNGNTYQFNSGAGNRYSTPTGEFRVTAHRNNRSDAGFVRNGVGFSFRMEDPRRPGSDRFYDPRAGRDRTALRIHPDGGGTGTAGCIGVVGDAATLRRFRDDMNAELRRNGGSYTLRVQ